jgi:hypothetical protein
MPQRHGGTGGDDRDGSENDQQPRAGCRRALDGGNDALDGPDDGIV